MIRRLFQLWANVKYWWDGLSELRIAGCSGTERCAPIRRVTTGLSPRPIATQTANTASPVSGARGATAVHDTQLPIMGA
jgi:hypothetical protein